MAGALNLGHEKDRTEVQGRRGFVVDRLGGWIEKGLTITIRIFGVSGMLSLRDTFYRTEKPNGFTSGGGALFFGLFFGMRHCLVVAEGLTES